MLSVYLSDTQNLKTVNTLTANDKYSLLNRDKLTQPIQMLLSQKEKRFSEHTSVFFKLTLNFDHIKKK